MFGLNILSAIRLGLIIAALSAVGYLVYDYLNMKKELEARAVAIAELKSSLEKKEAQLQKEKELRDEIRKLQDQTREELVGAVREELKAKAKFEAERLKRLSKKKSGLLTLKARKATEEKFSELEAISSGQNTP